MSSLTSFVAAVFNVAIFWTPLASVADIDQVLVEDERDLDMSAHRALGEGRRPAGKLLIAGNGHQGCGDFSAQLNIHIIGRGGQIGDADGSETIAIAIGLNGVFGHFAQLGLVQLL